MKLIGMHCVWPWWTRSSNYKRRDDGTDAKHSLSPIAPISSIDLSVLIPCVDSLNGVAKKLFMISQFDPVMDDRAGARVNRGLEGMIFCEDRILFIGWVKWDEIKA